MAGEHYLDKVLSPTLLLVGSGVEEGLALNRKAYAQLSCTKELSIIAGATHLFEEPGALEEVARQAAIWFKLHLQH